MDTNHVEKQEKEKKDWISDEEYDRQVRERHEYFKWNRWDDNCNHPGGIAWGQ